MGSVGSGRVPKGSRGTRRVLKDPIGSGRVQKGLGKLRKPKRTQEGLGGSRVDTLKINYFSTFPGGGVGSAAYASDWLHSRRVGFNQV